MSNHPFNRDRREYVQPRLHKKDLDSDPFTQFMRWLHEAREMGVVEPNAFCLATASQGIPSARMVLLKHFDEEKAYFFTNLESQKSRELLVQPECVAVFWWKECDRQVIFHARAIPLDSKENQSYFLTRPLKSRQAAWCSPQGKPLESREDLERRLDSQVSLDQCPAHWGGFALYPHRFEFWQGQPSRLHDRVLYTRHKEGWELCRLAP